MPVTIILLALYFLSVPVSLQTIDKYMLMVRQASIIFGVLSFIIPKSIKNNFDYQAIKNEVIQLINKSSVWEEISIL